jgi:hypothetical protein
MICISLLSNAHEHDEEGEQERVATEALTDQSKLLSTMYFFVRSRPDVVSVGNCCRKFKSGT